MLFHSHLLYISNKRVLTREIEAAGKSLCKLRPHINQKVSTLFELVLPLLQRQVDKGLKIISVQGVEDIADPLSIHMDPITLNWYVLKDPLISLE